MPLSASTVVGLDAPRLDVGRVALVLSMGLGSSMLNVERRISAGTGYFYKIN
jgi:hypothetical protein